MKKMIKGLLDELIFAERKYWETEDLEYCHEALALSQKLLPDGIEWISIKDFVTSIVMNRGLCKEASNEKIYKVLNLLGWEVVDEVKESESL